MRKQPWPDRGPAFRFTEIDPVRTALLVIDMQVVFVEDGQPAASPGARAIVPSINRVADALRRAGGLVAFTRHTETEKGPRALTPWQREHSLLRMMGHAFKAGAREHDVEASLDRRPEDVVIDKYRYSAFTHNSSDLHEILQERGIDTVIVTGVITNCCCETSARDASMLGYKTLFSSDATAAVTEKEHDAALLNLSAIFADVRPTDELLALIEKRDASVSRVKTT